MIERDKAADVRFWGGNRHRAYIEMARWFKKEIPTESTIMSPEVGTFAYHTDLHFIDLFRIVTKSVSKDMSSMIINFKPDYVLLGGTNHNKIYELPEPHRYKKIKQFTNEGFFSFSFYERAK